MRTHYTSRALWQLRALTLAVFCVGTALPTSAQQPSPSTLQGTETSDGLRTVRLKSNAGTVTVYLTADLTAGDTLTGTVVAEPTGRDARERSRHENELQGCVLALGDQQAPLKEGRFCWKLPAALAAGAIPLLLRDAQGKTLSTAEIPVQSIPSAPVLASAAPAFQLPTQGQINKPLSITGRFNGDGGDTSIQVGNESALVLAENPRRVIALSSSQATGPTTLTVREGGQQMQGAFRAIGLRLAASKTSLHPGERTPLMLEMRGLQGISENVAVQLTNRTPEIVTMERGNTQSLTIAPAEIATDGTYSATRMLTGTRPGTFAVTGNTMPLLLLKPNDPTEWIRGLPPDVVEALAQELKKKTKPGTGADQALDQVIEAAKKDKKVDADAMVEALRRLKLTLTLPQLAKIIVMSMATSFIPVLHEAAALVHIVELGLIGGELADEKGEIKKAAEAVKAVAKEVEAAKKDYEDAADKDKAAAKERLDAKEADLKKATDTLKDALPKEK